MRTDFPPMPDSLRPSSGMPHKQSCCGQDMEVWQSSFIEGCFYQGQGSEAGDYHPILHDPTFALATCWPAVRDVCSTCRCSPKRPVPRGTALGKPPGTMDSGNHSINGADSEKPDE